MCPARAARPAWPKVFKLSSNETPLGPSPQAIAAYKAAGGHLEEYPDGSASELREAIGRASGSIPIGSSAAQAPTISCISWPRPISSRRRGDPHRARLPDLSDRDPGAGAKPIVVPETNYMADVDAILAAVTKRRPKSSSSPTRTIRPAPACRSTRSSGCIAAWRPTCCSCSTRLTPNMSETTITRPASNLWRRRKTSSCAARSRRFMDWPRCGSAGCWTARTSSMRSTASAARSTSQRAGDRRGIAAIEDMEHQERSRQHKTRWLAWLTEEIGKLGLKVTPSVANSVLIHFPRDQGPHRQGRGRVPDRARSHPAARSPLTNCPTRCV